MESNEKENNYPPRRTHDLKRRRSSLKMPKLMDSNASSSVENSPVKPAKRVSFASSNTIKPFASDPDKVTIWDSTYEEIINHTDSTQSSQEQNSKTISKISVSSFHAEAPHHSTANFTNVSLREMEITNPAILLDKENIPVVPVRASILDYAKKPSNVGSCTPIFDLLPNIKNEAPAIEIFEDADNEVVEMDLTQLFDPEPNNCSINMEMSCEVPQANKMILEGHVEVGTKATESGDSCLNSTLKILGGDSKIENISKENFNDSTGKVMDDTTISCEINAPSPKFDVLESSASMEFTCQVPANIMKIVETKPVQIEHGVQNTITEKNDKDEVNMSSVNMEFTGQITNLSQHIPRKSEIMELTCQLPEIPLEKSALKQVPDVIQRSKSMEAKYELSNISLEATSLKHATPEMSRKLETMEFTCQMPNNIPKMSRKSEIMEMTCQTPTITLETSLITQNPDTIGKTEIMELTCQASKLPIRNSVTESNMPNLSQKCESEEAKCEVPTKILESSLIKPAPDASNKSETMEFTCQIRKKQMSRNSEMMEMTCQIPQETYAMTQEPHITETMELTYQALKLPIRTPAVQHLSITSQELDAMKMSYEDSKIQLEKEISSVEQIPEKLKPLEFAGSIPKMSLESSSVHQPCPENLIKNIGLSKEINLVASEERILYEPVSTMVKSHFEDCLQASINLEMKEPEPTIFLDESKTQERHEDVITNSNFIKIDNSDVRQDSANSKLHVSEMDVDMVSPQMQKTNPTTKYELYDAKPCTPIKPNVQSSLKLIKKNSTFSSIDKSLASIDIFSDKKAPTQTKTPEAISRSPKSKIPVVSSEDHETLNGENISSNLNILDQYHNQSITNHSMKMGKNVLFSQKMSNFKPLTPHCSFGDLQTPSTSCQERSFCNNNNSPLDDTQHLVNLPYSKSFSSVDASIVGEDLQKSSKLLCVNKTFLVTKENVKSSDLSEMVNEDVDDKQFRDENDSSLGILSSLDVSDDLKHETQLSPKKNYKYHYPKLEEAIKALHLKDANIEDPRPQINRILSNIEKINEINNKIVDIFTNYELKPLNLPHFTPIANKSSDESQSQLSQELEIDFGLEKMDLSDDTDSLVVGIKKLEEKSANLWKFVKVEKQIYYFSLFKEKFAVSVKVGDERGTVLNIETKELYTEKTRPLGIFFIQFLSKMLNNKSHLQSALGVNYDILSLVEYIDLNILKCAETKRYFSKALFSHGLRMKSSPIVEFQIVNKRLLLAFEITINLLNVDAICHEDVNIKLNVGEFDVSEIKRLIDGCPKNLEFVKTFIATVEAFLERQPKKNMCL